LKLAGAIGRTAGDVTGGEGASITEPPNRWGCDVHAAVTGLVKAGVEQGTEVENHGNGPRIAGADQVRPPRCPRSHSSGAICEPPYFRGILAIVVVQPFHVETMISL
jgi:hypothetical protein